MDVVAILREETARRRRTNRIVRPALAVLAALVGYRIVVGGFVGGDHDAYSLLPVFFLVSGVTGVGLSPLLKRTAREALSSPGATESLVELLDSGDAEIVPLARAVVAPRLDVISDLRPEALRALESAAEAPGAPRDFAAAAVRCLGRIGDRQSLLWLDRAVARGDHLGDLARQASVNFRMDYARRLVRDASEAAERNVAQALRQGSGDAQGIHSER